MIPPPTPQLLPRTVPVAVDLTAAIKGADPAGFLMAMADPAMAEDDLPQETSTPAAADTPAMLPPTILPVALPFAAMPVIVAPVAAAQSDAVIPTAPAPIVAGDAAVEAVVSASPVDADAVGRAASAPVGAGFPVGAAEVDAETAPPATVAESGSTDDAAQFAVAEVRRRPPMGGALEMSLRLALAGQAAVVDDPTGPALAADQIVTGQDGPTAASVPADALPMVGLSDGIEAASPDPDGGGVLASSDTAPPILHRVALSPASQGTPAPAAPVQPATTMAQLVAHLPAQGEGMVEVALSPGELGSVRIGLQAEGDIIRVVIAAERPETLDLMRRNGEALQQELRAAGYSGTELSFAGWGQRTAQGQGGQSQPDARVREGGADPAVPPEVEPHREPRIIGASLDIRI